MTDSTLLAKTVVDFLKGVYSDSFYRFDHRDVMVQADLGTLEQGARFIDVFELGWTSQPPIDRAEDEFDVRLAIVFRERYPDVPDPNFVVPMAWTEERKQFFEDLFNWLTNSRVEYITPGSVWRAQFGEVTTIYDYAKLDKHKVFWAEMEVVYRKTVEAGVIGIDAEVLSIVQDIVNLNETLVTFSKAVTLTGLPGWIIAQGFPFPNVTVIIATQEGSQWRLTWDVILAGGLSVTIPAQDPAFRTVFLNGYVTAGVIPIT